MNYRHKNLNTALAKVIQHVTDNIQNQEKLSANMKRFRRVRRLDIKSTIPVEKDMETIESERDDQEN